VNNFISVEWINLKSAEVKLNKTLPDAAIKMMQSKLVASITMIHTEAIRGISKTSMGKRETRYGPKRQVIVSKPGDPFNVDTGVTWTSIQYRVDVKALKSSIVGNNTAYWLERGTKNMEPRPWLRPALLKTMGKKVGGGLKLK
jgi:hypothetical protein